MLNHRLGHIGFVRIALSVLAVSIVGLTGCAYEYAPVRVDVRSRTLHEPMVGAKVTISNTHTINPKPPEPATGFTGKDGSVTLDVAIYNSLVIRIIHNGEPEHVFSAEHPALVGLLSWLGPIRTKGAATPTIEIRLRSPLTKLSEVE